MGPGGADQNKRAWSKTKADHRLCNGEMSPFPDSLSDKKNGILPENTFHSVLQVRADGNLWGEKAQSSGGVQKGIRGLQSWSGRRSDRDGALIRTKQWQTRPYYYEGSRGVMRFSGGLKRPLVRVVVRVNRCGATKSLEKSILGLHLENMRVT